MFDTFSIAEGRPVYAAGPAFMVLPAFLGSGVFLDSPDPRGPDEEESERWEDDGGPCPPEA